MMLNDDVNVNVVIFSTSENSANTSELTCAPLLAIIDKFLSMNSFATLRNSCSANLQLFTIVQSSPHELGLWNDLLAHSAWALRGEKGCYIFDTFMYYWCNTTETMGSFSL